MEFVNISFMLNKKDIKRSVPSDMTLLAMLRDELNMTGTKCGCEIGECGACTVVMDGDAVCSCLIMAAQVDGHEILTVEGISEGTTLSALQRAFVEKHAIQCGFCTPGMLMSATALLMKNPNPTEAEIRTAISGNLCRCTGYDSIVDAIKSVDEFK